MSLLAKTIRAVHPSLFPLVFVSGAACTQPTEPPPPSPLAATTVGCGAGAVAQTNDNGSYSLGVEYYNEQFGALALDAKGVVFGLDRDDRSGVAVLAGNGASANEGISTLSASTDPIILAVQTDATSIYYTTSDELHSVPRAGGTDATLFDSAVVSFVQAGDQLYAVPGNFAPGGESIVAIPKKGGAAATVYTVAAGAEIAALATDGQSLYWIETQGEATGIIPFPTETVVRSAPIATTLAASDLARAPWPSTVPVGLGASAGTVVFAIDDLQDDTPATIATSFAIYTLQAGGSPVIADQGPGPASSQLLIPLAVAGGFAYYDIGTGVKRYALDGSSAPETLEQPASDDVIAIAADASGGWAYENGNCVYRSGS